MKKILIPTDFSDVASYAIDMALKIQKRIEAQITLLHVVTQQDENSPSQSTSSEDKPACLKKLEKLKADFPTNIETVILEGKLNEVIINFLEDGQFDLVLMGTKGTIDRELGGSETEIIVRRSSVPVLSLMSCCKKSDFKNILFINDFKNEIEIEELNILKTIVAIFDSKLHFLKITDDNESELLMEKNMCDFARKNKLENVKMHFFSNDLGIEEGIESFLSKNDFDMLSLGTNRHLDFNHWKKSSIAEDLVNHINKPIITFHLPEE
ncbi:universal stress protein [Chondrinema litorale]|uniref:universal stress protein n=1 Tax=Chondrinema litorale TaxID=2994555 RepID=UPI002543E6C2|nr:universal stress protein [Chondrinema litorale]UZR99324.1 universal stress protein [Chondrinema litorale]